MMTISEMHLRETKQNGEIIVEYLNKAIIAISEIRDRQKDPEIRDEIHAALAGFTHCIGISQRFTDWSKGYLDMSDVPVSQEEIEQVYDLCSDMDDAFNRSVKSLRTAYKTCNELKRYAATTDRVQVSKHYIVKTLNLYQGYSK